MQGFNPQRKDSYDYDLNSALRRPATEDVSKQAVGANDINKSVSISRWQVSLLNYFRLSKDNI